jgi:hypothetical protein
VAAEWDPIGVENFQKESINLFQTISAKLGTIHLRFLVRMMILRRQETNQQETPKIYEKNRGFFYET